MTQYELESRWITEEGVPGVTYRFSDLVRIKSGEYSGQTTEVIALLALEPEPMYGVTLPPNEKFVVLPQSELESTGSSAGGALKLMPPGSTPFIKKPS
jgi:hypothetical protein